MGDRKAECLAILRHAAALVREGKASGLVLMIELPSGAYRAMMTGTDNAAERIGRAVLFQEHILDNARED